MIKKSSKQKKGSKNIIEFININGSMQEIPKELIKLDKNSCLIMSTLRSLAYSNNVNKNKISYLIVSIENLKTITRLSKSLINSSISLLEKENLIKSIKANNKRVYAIKSKGYIKDFFEYIKLLEETFNECSYITIKANLVGKLSNPKDDNFFKKDDLHTLNYVLAIEKEKYKKELLQ